MLKRWWQRWTAPSPEMSNLFIILGWGRSGSSMLNGTLQRHPDISALGELFHPDELKLAHFGDVDPPSCFRSLEERDIDPVRAFQALSTTPDLKPLRGCKLLYDQSPRLWDAVCGDRSLRKLLVWRSNRLRQFLSLRLAEESSHWSIARKDDLTQYRQEHFKPVHFAPDAFESYRRWTGQRWKALQKQLKARRQPFLTVTYEALKDDLEKELARIAGFLDVSPFPDGARPSNKQLHPDSVRKLVTNPDALEAYFSGTDDAWMLEE